MGIAQDIYQAVSPVFQSFDVPDYIWQSIGHMETGGTFDPKALGDNGRSFGLFQLFTDGGQGDAYAGNPDVLFDPGLNSRVAAPEIARAYHLGRELGLSDGPDLAAFTAANSGHPGYGISMDDPAIQAVYKAANQYFQTAGVGKDVAEPGAKPQVPWYQRIPWGGTVPIPNDMRDGPWYNSKPNPEKLNDASIEAAKGSPWYLQQSWWQGAWKSAATYGVVVVIAIILLAVSVQAMVRPAKA